LCGRHLDIGRPLDFNVSFLRVAQAGPLRGKARLVRRGREVCHVVGELMQGDALVATAPATCMVVRRAG